MGQRKLKLVHKDEARLMGQGGDILTLTQTMLRFWKNNDRAIIVARYEDIQSVDVFFGEEYGEYQIQLTGRLLYREPGCERECSKAMLSILLSGWAHTDVVSFLERNSPLRTSEAKERAAIATWYARVIDAPGPRGQVTIAITEPVEMLEVLVNGRPYKDLSTLKRLVTTVYVFDLPLGRFIIQTRSLPAKWPHFAKNWVRAIPSTSVIIELTPESDDIVLYLKNQFPLPLLVRHKRKESIYPSR